MDIKGQNQKQKKPRSDSFIEALRDLSGDTFKNLSDDFFKQMPSDALKQSGLRPQKGESSESDFFRETQDLQGKLTKSEYRRTQEQILFTSRNQEEKKHVQALVVEAQKLSQAITTLEKQVDVAVFQAPVNPGVYHVNFFEQLICFIKSLTKKVEDASMWMQTSNHKSKKKSHFWNQAEKSGSKFLLSHDRQVATQTG